jgi:GntR family transcriptional repressor for pyruvate dehydrogenase complex
MRSDEREVWTPTRAEKVSESLARRILSDITDGNLAPGSQLPPEAEMLQQFTVGRGSLREALRILEVYGVITIRSGPGGGPVVQVLGSREFARAAAFYFHVRGSKFRDVIEARRDMEPLMARLAAKGATDDVVQRLERNVEASRQVAKGELPARDWSRHSMGFHTLVADSSGNSVLALFTLSLRDIYYDWIDGRSMAAVSDHKQICNEHAAILKGITAGDGEAAENAMREHLDKVTTRIIKKLDFMLDDVIRWE